MSTYPGWEEGTYPGWEEGTYPGRREATLPTHHGIHPTLPTMVYTPPTRVYHVLILSCWESVLSPLAGRVCSESALGSKQEKGLGRSLSKD